MSAQPAERRIRTFYFHRADGSLCGSVGCSDHPGFEEGVRRDAEERGEGVIEHNGEPLDLSHDRVDIATGKLLDPLDRAFAADLNAQWQSILRLFPQLANPVPPAPLSRQNGTYHFKMSEFWADFSERAASGKWHLRAACDDLERLVGPFRAHGRCLTPVFAEGRVDWYDPSLAAQDEDIVLVHLDNLACQRIHERNRHRPEWMEMYGRRPNPLCTKLLKAFGGEYWLATNDGMFPLGKNRVLGVLRHTRTKGESKYAVVPCIGPGAATVVAEVTDNSASLVNGGGVILDISVPAQGMVEGYQLQVLATFDVWITSFGGGTPTFQIVVLGNGSTLVTSQVATPAVTTSPGQRIALQASAHVDLADESGSGVVAQLVWTGAAPAGTAEARNISLRAELVKR